MGPRGEEKDMKFSRKNQGNFLISKDFSGNSLFKERSIGLQPKSSFVFSIFWDGSRTT